MTITDLEFNNMIENASMKNIKDVLEKIKQQGGLSRSQTDALFYNYNFDKEKGIELENSIFRTILIFSYEKFINYVLNKLNIFDEDCFSVGKIGLIKAIDSYQIDKDVTFMTYAYTCIKNEVLLTKRGKHLSKQVVSLDETQKKDGEKFSLYETLKDDYNFIEEIEDRSQAQSILKLLKHLTSLEQYLLLASIGFYEPPVRQKELSERSGLSQPYICKVLSSAINNIRIVSNPSKCLDVNYINISNSNYEFLDYEAYKNFDFSKRVKKERYIAKRVEQIQVDNANLENDKTLSTIKMLKHFTPQEQICLIYKFGLYNNKTLNYRQVAKILNVSDEEAYELYYSSIYKLKILSTNSKDLAHKELQAKRSLKKNEYEVLDENNYKTFFAPKKRFFVASR